MNDEDKRFLESALIRLRSGDPLSIVCGQWLGPVSIFTMTKEREDKMRRDLEEHCRALLDGEHDGKQA